MGNGYLFATFGMRLSNAWRNIMIILALTIAGAFAPEIFSWEKFSLQPQSSYRDKIKRSKSDDEESAVETERGQSLYIDTRPVIPIIRNEATFDIEGA